jgi:hypothetical protein
MTLAPKKLVRLLGDVFFFALLAGGAFVSAVTVSEAPGPPAGRRDPGRGSSRYPTFSMWARTSARRSRLKSMLSGTGLAM